MCALNDCFNSSLSWTRFTCKAGPTSSSALSRSTVAYARIDGWRLGMGCGVSRLTCVPRGVRLECRRSRFCWRSSVQYELLGICRRVLGVRSLAQTLFLPCVRRCLSRGFAHCVDRPRRAFSITVCPFTGSRGLARELLRSSVRMRSRRPDRSRACSGRIVGADLLVVGSTYDHAAPSCQTYSLLRS